MVSDAGLKTAPRAWLMAAENDWIPGGKVGGVGDVIRDLPPALAQAGWPVRVVVPSYGVFHRMPGARAGERISGRFRGEAFEAQTWCLPSDIDDVEQWVIDHSRFSIGGGGSIYHPDPPDRPYETDSGKFAFFCAAVAAWLEQVEHPPEVLHLHDWHTGLMPFLRSAPHAAPGLANCRMVYTIHNLAYQGVRPLRETEASMATWFPEWAEDAAEVLDPHDPSLVNFMAAALRGADAVSTVSPTYAHEIRRPNDPARGFHGGEGLEDLLNAIASEGRLVGILNGCEYPETTPSPNWEETMKAMLAESTLFDRLPELRRRAEALAGRRPACVLLAIGRIVSQKVDLFLEPAGGAETALDAIAGLLKENEVFMLLGSGDPVLERRLREVSARQPRFLFLRGYAEALSELLYETADCFLMPSSFEPCGISQMLALRAGQPCVVHGVGGLRDTVEDGVTGFVFEGDSVADQAQGLVDAVTRALDCRRNSAGRWRAMSEAAAAQRFSWELAARHTITSLYEHDGDAGGTP
jgi:starch synthase